MKNQWLHLLTSPLGRYPSLRVAYIDEVEERSTNKNTRVQIYYSALVKAAAPTKSIDSSEPVQTLDQVRVLRILWRLNGLVDKKKKKKKPMHFPTVCLDILLQVIYKIKLPGPAILGEGKPENQNHAIIFTRGEGLQTIDMNQVFYKYFVCVEFIQNSS